MGFSDRDFWVMLAFVGVIGWAVISGVIWIGSHLHIAWV